MITSQNTLLRIQLGMIVSYFIVKFAMRPFILENEHGGFPKIFVLSYPNFCEAIAGTIMLIFFLLILNERLRKTNFRVDEKYMPLMSVLISGPYVLLQEYNIHEVGGENVFDFNDVIFSLLGLVTVLCLLIYIKPKIERGEQPL